MGKAWSSIGIGTANHRPAGPPTQAKHPGQYGTGPIRIPREALKAGLLFNAAARRAVNPPERRAPDAGRELCAPCAPAGEEAAQSFDRAAS